MVAKCNENRITGKQTRERKKKLIIKDRIENATHYPECYIAMSTPEA